jgi:predicted N-acetyltransferase YhbS
MKTLEAYAIRMPVCADELESVRMLRATVLDPARGVMPEETALHDEDFYPQTILRAAFIGRSAISTARFDMVNHDGLYVARKVATDPYFCGQGVGSETFMSGEQEAIRRGASQIILSARLATVGFYEKLGYETTGKTIRTKDGRENYKMAKQVA